jgi:HK97 family phage portal protein
MGLLNLVRPVSVRSGPEYATPGFLPWSDFVTSAEASGPVSLEEAQGLPGVGHGVAIIGGVISQLQPRLYLRDNDPTSASIPLATPPLLLDPDPAWHGLDAWLESVSESLAWWGNAFAYRGVEVSDTRGHPLRLPLLETERVEWDQTDYVLSTDQGRETFSPPEILHMVTGARAGRRMGTGILQRYQSELKIMRATEGAQFVLMEAGKPMGIISLGQDVTSDEAAEYKAAVMQAMKTDGIAAMGQADFKPLNWNAADLTMIPTREFNLRLASDITGVPPYMLGVPSESRVYSNMETEWTNFIRVTMGRYTKAINTGLSRCYPRTQSVRLDITALMRGSAPERWAVYQIGIQSGALTVNEVRGFENMPALPEPPAPPPPNDNNDTDDEEEVDEDE